MSCMDLHFEGCRQRWSILNFLLWSKGENGRPEKANVFTRRGIIILLYQNRYSDTRLARTFGRCSSRSARSITCVDRTQHISRVRTIDRAAYSDDVQT